MPNLSTGPTCGTSQQGCNGCRGRCDAGFAVPLLINNAQTPSPNWSVGTESAGLSQHLPGQISLA